MTEEIKRKLEKIKRHEEIVVLKCLVHSNLKKKIKRSLLNKNIIMSIMILILFTAIINYYYNYLVPISSLIIIPLFTLLLLIIWDIIKESYKSKNRLEEILFAFNGELIRNFENLLKNRSQLNRSLVYLKKGRNEEEKEMNAAPLYKIQLDVYDTLRQIFPEQLMDMGYFKIEEYVGLSHEINEFKRAKELSGMHRHLEFKNYISAIENIDNQIIENIGELLEIIRSIFLKSKVQLLELDINGIKELTEEENYFKFLKLHKLTKNSIPIETFVYLHEKEPSKLFIAIIYG